MSAYEQGVPRVSAWEQGVQGECMGTRHEDERI